MEEKRIETIKEAQKLVKDFANRNNWKDIPNVDKFDHLHEELIEMSQHLRYKSEDERKKIVEERKDVFKDGIGVKVNNGVIVIKELQLEGKKNQDVTTFMNGAGRNLIKVDKVFK